MRRLHVVGIILVLAVALRLEATAQIPDQLTIGDRKYFIHTNPLGPILRERGDRLPEPGSHSTGLWRGYIAEWSLRDGKLYLDDVKVPMRGDDEYLSAMKNLFDEPGARVAEWYSGHLVIPTGEIVRYVHMGYGTTYSSYIVATVEKGVVREQRSMNEKQFEAFRRTQFAKFKKTKDYAYARGETREPDDKKADEFLYEFAAEAYLSMIFPK